MATKYFLMLDHNHIWMYKIYVNNSGLDMKELLQQYKPLLCIQIVCVKPLHQKSIASRHGYREYFLMLDHNHL